MSINSDEYYLALSRHYGLCKDDLIYPIFITESNQPEKLVSMPGVIKIPYSKIIDSVDNIVDKDIRTLILFGIPKNRNNDGSIAFSPNGIVQKTLRVLKTTFGSKLNLISDICLCQYNKSGHCGILDTKNNKIKNDETIEYLGKIATSHSDAGADIVAPSSMMDGQVKFIREKLDAEGYRKTKILSFSAKLSSCLYKPFRMEAFHSRNQKNLDKSSYQVSYYNTNEILREIEFDVREGADMIMLKPSISNLDLIHQVSKLYKIPIVVQVVSGEYSMIKAASSIGMIDENHYLINLLGALKRSGANKIISYSNLHVSKYIATK